MTPTFHLVEGNGGRKVESSGSVEWSESPRCLSLSRKSPLIHKIRMSVDVPALEAGIDRRLLTEEKTKSTVWVSFMSY